MPVRLIHLEAQRYATTAKTLCEANQKLTESRQALKKVQLRSPVGRWRWSTQDNHLFLIMTPRALQRGASSPRERRSGSLAQRGGELVSKQVQAKVVSNDFTCQESRSNSTFSTIKGPCDRLETNIKVEPCDLPVKRGMPRPTTFSKEVASLCIRPAEQYDESSRVTTPNHLLRCTPEWQRSTWRYQ